MISHLGLSSPFHLLSLPFHFHVVSVPSPLPLSSVIHLFLFLPPFSAFHPAKVLGERCKLPSDSGRIQANKRLFVSWGLISVISSDQF